MKHLVTGTAFVAVLAFSPSAFALDAQGFIDRYAAFSKSVGQKFSYGEVTQSGDGFTVTNPSWTIADVPEIKGEKLVFSNVTETASGGFSIGNMTAEAISLSGEGVTATFGNFLMNDLHIPGENETDPIKKVMYYSRAEINNVNVTFAGQNVFSMNQFAADVSEYSKETPMDMKSSGDMAFDLSVIPDPQFKQTMAALGYDGKFTGQIILNATWNLSNGDMDITQYDMKVDNVGTLSFPISIGGYTIETLLKMQEESAKMNEIASAAEREAATMKMFSDLKSIAFKAMTIRFTDDSITNRGLKMASTIMGQPADQIAQGAPFMIGAAMGQLNMPELTQKVSAAVGAFLQNPKNIAITVQPNEPISAGNFDPSLANNPPALIKLLNLDVKANQ
ncbi:MAG: hypothetical protein AAF468_08825 [Pseudomonadota bacterium]